MGINHCAFRANASQGGREVRLSSDKMGRPSGVDRGKTNAFLSGQETNIDPSGGWDASPTRLMINYRQGGGAAKCV